MGAVGGSEFSQTHNHSFTGNSQTVGGDAGGISVGGSNQGVGSGPTGNFYNASIGGNTVTVTPSGTIGSSGSGSSQNVMPSIINFLPLIKT
jgi:hypothetical protein